MPDLRSPHHLPNLRPGKRPPHPSWLPRQRRGITPQMVGRYPDYDVLTTMDTWDDATRRAVTSRMSVPKGPLTFFAAAEEAALRALCDTVTAQDAEPRVPVAEMVDARLAAGKLDGYRYSDMPDDRVTWHLVLRGLDETARQRYNADGYAALPGEARDALVAQMSKGALRGGAWDELNVKRAFSVCMRYALGAFYAHPWAWNEIGFGGPAYPRGFMAMGPVSYREPFETPGATSEDPVVVEGGGG